MTEVVCAWQMRLMTDADPLLVASVYTALQLPIFFMVIPAGVLTDLADRRQVMIWTHAWLAFSLGLLLWLTLSDELTPTLLLLGLPLIAVGQAIRMPGMSTLIPDLVEKAQIPAAVSLNSIAQNTSRMLGPALAGVVIASVGVSAVLALNLVLMAAIVWLFVRLPYQSEHPHGAMTWPRFVSAVAEGVRFSASTNWQRNILIRLGVLFVCASPIPALMAVRFSTSELYGYMYACFGAGSLLGLIAIARLGHKNMDQRLNRGLVVCAFAVTLSGATDEPALAGPLLAIVGGSWIFGSNSLLVAAQTQLATRMRGRGLSFLYAVGTACLGGGGLIWGAIARSIGHPTTLVAAGLCLLLLMAITFRLSVTKVTAET